MVQIVKKLLIFFILSIFAKPVFSQEKTGFAIDPSANNIAALFTMTNENGRLRNLELMESIFKDGSLGFACQRHHNVSSNYIYEKLKELATNLDKDATLLVYFNSHGGGSGDRFAMTAQGGSFKFSKALDSLGKSNKKIRRLIFLVDTCHAEGSIQDSTKQDGELLKNLKYAVPTNSLPELPSQYSRNELPFLSFFLDVENKNGKKYYVSSINFGIDSGIYDELLIISSSSVEDLSIRGAFASRLANTFEKIKNEKEITVGEFLKKFADSHGSSGQQPHYKILPDNSMLNELLFGLPAAFLLPIIDRDNNKKLNSIEIIPLPMLRP
jgi:hypothetical protein